MSLPDHAQRFKPLAIPTTYRGCRFRSRLEARWAIFFDTAGIRWEYEAQGYNTPAGPYLPDFVLHLSVFRDGDRAPQPVLFEVKPPTLQVREDRWLHASAAAEMPLVLATGMPHPDDPVGFHEPNLPNGYLQLLNGMGWWSDDYHAFCLCPWCGEVGITYNGRGARVCGPSAHGLEQCLDKNYTYEHPRLIQAYEAALGAQFEHGESGAA